jgi:hypothetical protein
MANGYDILAKSVDKFASVINKLDPIKMTSFTRLTGNIALLSALDSKMFDNMLKVLERRGGVFVDMLKIQTSEISGVNLNPKEGDDKKDKKDTKKVGSKGKSDSEKLDMVVELLSKITYFSEETSENTGKLRKKLAPRTDTTTASK